MYGRDILSYLDELASIARKRGSALDLAEARRQAGALASLAPAAPIAERQRAGAANRALMLAERDLLVEEGLPGRPWFRHLIYAPLPSYAAETLPGISEALEADDAERAQAQAGVLAAALERCARRVGASSGSSPRCGGYR